MAQGKGTQYRRTSRETDSFLDKGGMHDKWTQPEKVGKQLKILKKNTLLTEMQGKNEVEAA